MPDIDQGLQQVRLRGQGLKTEIVAPGAVHAVEHRLADRCPFLRLLLTHTHTHFALRFALLLRPSYPLAPLHGHPPLATPPRGKLKQLRTLQPIPPRLIHQQRIRRQPAPRNRQMQRKLARHALPLRERDAEEVVAADAVRLGFVGGVAGVDAEFVDGTVLHRGSDMGVVVA